MSIKIAWQPSGETDIASYNVERSTSVNGPFALVVNIPYNLSGPNYDSGQGVFFYQDDTGTTLHYYRLIAVDTAGQKSAPSSPFRATTGTPATNNLVRVDHNYNSTGYLRYQTLSGSPIEGAVVRVYKKIDFDQGATDAPLAITLTDVNGNWVNPVYLVTGYTYVVQFHREGLYGPDKVETLV